MRAKINFFRPHAQNAERKRRSPLFTPMELLARVKRLKTNILVAPARVHAASLLLTHCDLKNSSASNAALSVFLYAFDGIIQNRVAASMPIPIRG